MLQKFITPCILESLDKQTIVYCGSKNSERGTLHGVCLKSKFSSDIGLIAPAFRSELFTVYQSRDIAESWKPYIADYDRTYGTKNSYGVQI